MKTRTMIVTALLAVTAGLLAFERAAELPPSGLRDAVAGDAAEFDTAIPVFENGGGNLPLPEAERAETEETRKGTGFYTVQNPVGVSSVTVDGRTGLMWITNPEAAGLSGAYSWRAARNACANLRYAGCDDWTLPSDRQLSGLVERKSSSPSIDTRYFLNIQPSYYWTATPYTDPSFIPRVWTVNFNGGGLYYASKLGNSYYLICVRNAGKK